MKPFVAHLRREAGEHRPVLLGLAVAVPVLVGAAFVGFAGAGVRMAALLPEVLGAMALLAALSVSTESFAGERARGTIDGLRRLPGGLRRACAGKLAFLGLAVLAAVAWTFAWFAAACAVFPGTRSLADVVAALDGRAALLVLGALTFSTWVLFASTWVPRGATAVTLALGVPALLAAPAVLVWGEGGFLDTLLPQLPAALAVLLGIALVGAAWGFVRGLRHQGRLGRAAWLGLPLVLLPTAAGYAWVDVRHDRWMHVAPEDPEARLEVTIGFGARYAWVNLRRGEHWATNRPLRVDLRDGTVEPLGPVGAWVASTTGKGTSPLLATAGAVELGDLSASRLTPRAHFDAATGAPLPPEARETCERAAARRSSSHRGPRGLEWALHDRLERDGPDGSGVETVRAGSGWVFRQPWGWTFARQGTTVGLAVGGDPDRDAVPLIVDGGDQGVVWIGPGRYLATRGSGRPGTPSARAWALVDRRAGTRVAAPGLLATDRYVARVAGDLALVATATGLARVDLGSGERRDLEVPAALGDASGAAVYGAREDGRLVVTIGGRGWGLLDLEAGAFVGTIPV
ncbi:MAG: ABC transporter permease, partial [Planctomycetia bacterium]|nr:ABC transporter permease [Planctomycetia bacterium]